jgi:cell division protein FtsB
VVTWGAEATAQPRTVTSNSRVLLDGTLFDSATGNDVRLVGLFHLQTRLDVTDDSLAVHANVMEGLFAAYVAPQQPPSDPRLAALADEVNELAARIAELKAQFLERQAQIGIVQKELEQVLSTDTNPVFPGVQIDERKALELARRLAQLQAQVGRLQREVSDIMATINRLLDEIDRQSGVEEMVVVYRAVGVAAVPASPCSDRLVCERIVGFDLVRAGGGVLPFEVRLTMQFTTDGKLLLGAVRIHSDGGGDIESSVTAFAIKDSAMQ